MAAAWRRVREVNEVVVVAAQTSSWRGQRRGEHRRVERTRRHEANGRKRSADRRMPEAWHACRAASRSCRRSPASADLSASKR